MMLWCPSPNLGPKPKVLHYKSKSLSPSTNQKVLVQSLESNAKIYILKSRSKIQSYVWKSESETKGLNPKTQVDKLKLKSWKSKCLNPGLKVQIY